MSSGSNAPRKPNVAASASHFKTSSRFLHSGERNGPGSVSRGMKRQRAGPGSLDREVLSAESKNNITEVARCFALEEQKDSSSSGGVKSNKKRFVGVRQRPSGRWVAEIKDTTQKIRLWLGTFDSAEEGAKAYDSAARALRGNNTRTNFVPAMACEGTVPASKAARLIRLRQMAAASKACEKEAARSNAAPPEQKGADKPNLAVKSSQVVNRSPLTVRQDFPQQSISSLDDPQIPNSPAVVDHTQASHRPSSPPKPARLIGRRHNNNAPLACAKPKPQQHEDDAPPFAAAHDHGTVDNGGPGDHSPAAPPVTLLEPQQSVTSETFSNIITHSPTAGSPLESSSSPPLRLSSPRSPIEFMKSMSMADGVHQSTVSTFEQAKDLLTSFAAHRSPPLESFDAFPVDNFVAPSQRLVPFRSDLVAYPHQIHSCATNRDHISMYAAAAAEKQVQQTNPNDDENDAYAMNVDVDAKLNCGTETKRGPTRASTGSLVNEETMEYASSEVNHARPTPELPEREHDGCVLRERESAVPELVVPELAVPEIPWSDFELFGELHLDLSCEHSGVYNSFDFATDTIDRDSCTSGVLLEEHLSDDDNMIFRMPYEQSSSTPPATSQDFQECVLVREPSELEYSLSPHETSNLPGGPGGQMSPPETANHSFLWKLDDTTTAWDGQSSGSSESTTADHVHVKQTQRGVDGDGDGDGDGHGECTSSQDQEAMWNSVDLAPLCMVA